MLTDAPGPAQTADEPSDPAGDLPQEEDPARTYYAEILLISFAALLLGALSAGAGHVAVYAGAVLVLRSLMAAAEARTSRA